jgi:hypothetical protein
MMVPIRLLATSSILLLAAALAGAAGAPPAASAAAGAPAGAAPPAAAPAGTMAPTAPAAAAAPAGPAGPANAAGAGGAAGPLHRIDLPGPEGKRFPYTIEVPAGWQVQASKTVPGVFVGPPAASDPENDVRMIYVRNSPASLQDPAAVVANIKKSVTADWSAPIVEVREVGGVRGILVRMDSGSGEQARSTLVLKLPLGQSSVDFMASAPRAEFERLLPGYERVILSVRPVR